jgi:hypothetical protein
MVRLYAIEHGTALLVLILGFERDGGRSRRHPPRV